MSESVYVFNLLTGEENYYKAGTDPVQAVKVSYALENGLDTQLAAHGYSALEHLKVLRGKRCVTCGDWTAIVN